MSDDTGMAPPAPAPVDICRLCHTHTTLKWSHIVPRWTYRRVVQTGGDPNPVTVDGDVAVFGGEQAAEYMLCGQCEQRLGRWETYVSGVALQSDDAFPALAAAKSRPTITVGDWQVADLSSLDTEAISRFAASVVWRASASQLFSGVSLGAHADSFAAYVLTDGAMLPSSARLLINLLDPPAAPRIDRVVVAPASSREGGYHVHHFAMFGMWFRLMVGNAIPRSFDEICLARSRRGVITSGAELTRLVATRAHAVTPKGKLAKRS